MTITICETTNLEIDFTDSNYLNSASKRVRVCKKKTSSLRLAKRQKTQFTDVNEHFCCKRYEKIGVFLQTLNTNGTLPLKVNYNLPIIRLYPN